MEEDFSAERFNSPLNERRGKKGRPTKPNKKKGGTGRFPWPPKRRLSTRTEKKGKVNSSGGVD